MKLIFQQYKEDEVVLIRTALKNNANKLSGLPSSCEKDREEAVVVSAPHHVYHLNSKDIIHEKGLKNVFLNGLQYLLLSGGQVIGSAEIKNNDHQKTIQLNYGSFYKTIADVISLAEEHQSAGEYEFALLKIPSIYVVAVWLRSANKNLFIPFGDVPQEYQSRKLYSEEEFFRPAKRLSLINIQF